MSSDERAPAAQALRVLAEGDIDVLGRMPWSSNGTFLVMACLGDTSVQAIYKPYRGERPLWDFPDGLYTREVAAYELSVALGWDLVPETVLRDGPLGVGSLQRFVEADFAQHYFTLLEDPAHHPALRRMAVFDIVANNADRKGGHCLLGPDGRIHGIDHGLCFHVEPKLRTVIWDFGGEAVPAPLVADLERLVADPPGPLLDLLRKDEAARALSRAATLVRKRTLPNPGPSRRPYPWPLV